MAKYAHGHGGHDGRDGTDGHDGRNMPMDYSTMRVHGMRGHPMQPGRMDHGEASEPASEEAGESMQQEHTEMHGVPEQHKAKGR